MFMQFNISVAVFILFFVAALRSTINRMRFDEIMTFAWQFCLPIVWGILLLMICTS